MFVAVVWHARRHQTALEALRRSGARDREFVRHASHQLRTPITVARGHLELLRAATADPQSTEDADVVISKLDRLSRISERLLILGTADHVDFIAHAPVDLRTLAQDTVLRWAPAADRRWRAEIEADGIVEGDAERLEAALDALVENAIKATGAGDLIALRVRSLQGEAVLELSDAGVGIAPEDLPRVFDRFWSFSAEGTPRSGTGLGLATVKTIAEAHGGHAEALARPGGGTTIRIGLGPFLPTPRRPAAAIGPHPAPARVGVGRA
jgi:signal transduction histidine kinase